MKRWNDNSCPSGKRLFENQAIAEEALLQNHIMNDHRRGGGPINVYLCNDCGSWHFTSKGIRNGLLDDPEIIRKIESAKRAFEWERRLK